MRAFIRFNKGMMSMPLPWRLWVGLLAMLNLVAPLFFLDRPESLAVLAAFLASGVLMTVLTGTAGFTRLLGLGHFPWFPLLYLLGMRLGEIPAADAFGIWIRVLIIVNAASLVLDVTDVVRYLAGDRAPTVKDLAA